MSKASTTYLKATSLAVAFLAASACTTMSVNARPLPIELPVVLRGEAPDYERQARVELIGDRMELEEILSTNRLDQENTRQLIEQISPHVAWWLVVPPAQPSGGHRLRITLDGMLAEACLVPPRGAATAAFTKKAYLVALPLKVDQVRWHEACP